MLNIQNIRIPGLDPVNVSLKAGHCLGLTGDSGTGKTRILRAIADMDEYEGDVCVNDLCRQDVPAHDWRKQVCLLPAESQWWFDTVEPHFTETVTDFSRLGFNEDVSQWQISHCSSGEKQRLAILRMLTIKPRVLLLDEPTANLDTENTRKVETLITQYLSENDAAAIWVSHNRAQLRRVSPENCYELVDGKLEQMKD